MNRSDDERRVELLNGLPNRSGRDRYAGRRPDEQALDRIEGIRRDVDRRQIVFTVILVCDVSNHPNHQVGL